MRKTDSLDERKEYLPGHPSSEVELRELGFSPLSLELRRYVNIPDGVGCEWDLIGAVPEFPGHYLFTVEEEALINVTYAGLTGHLWMVTKGRLPNSGGARGGQRYGRPSHAGGTRQRINVLVAEQLRLGCRVRHWLRPLAQAVIADGNLSDALVRGEDGSSLAGN